MTTPIQVPLTMACYLIMNDGDLFYCMHDFVYVNMNLLVSCYPRLGKLDVEDEFVEISVAFSSLNSEDQSLCPMTDYWTRSKSLKQFNYMELVQSHHLVKNTKADGGKHWVLNADFVEKILVVNGRQLPNRSKTLSAEDLEFYFMFLLVMFKPHSSRIDLSFQIGKPEGTLYFF